MDLEKVLNVLFTTSAGQMFWLTALLAASGGYAWSSGKTELFESVLGMWLLRLGIRQASPEMTAKLIHDTYAAAKPKEGESQNNG